MELNKPVIIEYKINNCPTTERKLLICPTRFDAGNQIKLIQNSNEKQVEYNLKQGVYLEFDVAEICMKEFYIHQESIDTSNYQTSNISYKSKPQNYNQKMKAIPYITGFKFIDGEKKISLYLEKHDAQNDGFEFTFSTSVLKSVQRIDFNYLYYEENSSNSYFKVEQLKNQRQFNPPLIPGPNENIAVVSSIEKIPISHYCTDIDSEKCGILAGLNGFYLHQLTKPFFAVLIVEIRNKQVNQTVKKYLDITYQQCFIQLNGMGSQFIMFQMIKCNFDPNSKTQINFYQNCIEQCPVCQYPELDAKRNIIVCKKCNPTCNSCQNAFECLSCNANKYFFQKQCLDIQPKSTYCIKK